ncbi:MAG: DNA repair protein RadA [Patescibacteria group bacterium]
MAKSKTVYICQQCGQQTPRWAGQCGSCGAWNSLVEEIQESTTGKSSFGGGGQVAESIEPISVAAVQEAMTDQLRTSTGLTELDRVLGSSQKSIGTVEGSVLLIGGEPGIGKSTVLTQVALYAARAQTAAGSSAKGSSRAQVLYVCGEESPSQIALRINRILDNEQIDSSKKQAEKKQIEKQRVLDQLQFVPSTDVDRIIATIRSSRPKLVIIDSIQTMKTSDLSGIAGSVGQVRESAERLTQVAKELGVTTWIVGHVTKEGQLAGPKVLEHIVDAVLELSGERGGELRLVRAIKNRFGATDEVGVFQLTEFGFESVENPSQLFLEHEQNPVTGSATVCVMEGTRPLLLEVQALAVSTQMAMPRRVGRGIEQQRLHIITAVLQKYCRIPLDHYDVYVSLAGGFRSAEPSLDLGIAVAVASSMGDKALPAKAVCIGEVGLLGELRHVSYYERRVKEAKRLGYTQIISKEEFPSLKEALQKFAILK